MSDNNKAGVFAYAKDFSASLRFAQNDGKKFGLNLREKTPQSILWIASSPFGGGAYNKVSTKKQPAFAKSQKRAKCYLLLFCLCGASRLDSSTSSE
jgi:hypothetical protein